MEVKFSLDSRYVIDNLGKQESMLFILTELMRINDVSNLRLRMDADLASRAILAFTDCIKQLEEINREHYRRSV